MASQMVLDLLSVVVPIFLLVFPRPAPHRIRCGAGRGTIGNSYTCLGFAGVLVTDPAEPATPA